MMTNGTTIYVLDDNEVFLQDFLTCLKQLGMQFFPDGFQVYGFTSGNSLLSAAEQDMPDLLIADIDLNCVSETGISIAAQLKQSCKTCAVIYLTAYLDYATEIYETSPLYFILKSDYQRRLPAALQLFVSRRQSQKRNVIQVTSGRKPITISLDSIRYCEHVGKNTILYCTDATYSVRTPLQEFYRQLPQERFCMCHKGFIVNLAYVKSYSLTLVELTDNSTLPLGRAYKNEFTRKYTLWLGRTI